MFAKGTIMKEEPNVLESVVGKARASYGLWHNALQAFSMDDEDFYKKLSSIALSMVQKGEEAWMAANMIGQLTLLSGQPLKMKRKLKAEKAKLPHERFERLNEVLKKAVSVIVELKVE